MPPPPVWAKCPCTSPAWCLEYLREQEAHCSLCHWTHCIDCSLISIPAYWLRCKATITAVSPAKGRGTGNYILSLLAPSPGLCCWLEGATGQTEEGVLFIGLGSPVYVLHYHHKYLFSGLLRNKCNHE